jgi:hypothetical protein
MTDAAPELVDPEIAARLLNEHLDEFFATSPRVTETDWCQHDDAGATLSRIVGIPAVRPDGTKDRYHLCVDASYYDTWPVRVTFVGRCGGCDGDPAAGQVGGPWMRARLGQLSYPRFEGATPFEFALHDSYSYPAGREGQLICFSYSFDYYLSGHNPNDGQKWRPGKDKVVATLSRLFVVLNSTAYLGASGVGEPANPNMCSDTDEASHVDPGEEAATAAAA